MKARIKFSLISIHRKLENYLAPFFFFFFFLPFFLWLLPEIGLGLRMDLRVKGQFSRKETDLGQGTDLELKNGPRG